MWSSTPSFETSLVLNDSGSSSTSPSRLPRMLVEYQPSMPSRRAFRPGRQQRLHERLAGLEVLAGDGHAVLPRQLQQRRGVHGQVGGAVGVRDAALQRGVGVDLRGGDLRVALAQALLEGGQRGVHRRRARGTPRSIRTRPSPGGRSCSVLRKLSMSAITCSARSIFDLPVLAWVAVSFLTYSCSNTGGHRLDAGQELLERLAGARCEARPPWRRPGRRRRGTGPSRRTPGRPAWPAARTP